MQEALADGSAKALDEARMRVGVLEAAPHIRQGRQGLRQADHDVEELADAHGAHRLVHIVLQPLGPGAERPVLCMHKALCQVTASHCCCLLAWRVLPHGLGPGMVLAMCMIDFLHEPSQLLRGC